MGDDGFAFAAQPVDQRADAGFILRIGAFDLVDLAVDQRFQFDGARQEVLRCDYALCLPPNRDGRC